MHIMSENLCFPGKLANGHIVDLIKKDVDRIFYPMIFYEKDEFSDAANTFNCPVVLGYPDVVHNVIDPKKKYDIPLDMPAITLRDGELLDKTCIRYLAGLGIRNNVIKKALRNTEKAKHEYKKELRELGADVLKNSAINKHPIILILGRPYYIDPLINHNISNMIRFRYRRHHRRLCGIRTRPNFRQPPCYDSMGIY